MLKIDMNRERITRYASGATAWVSGSHIGQAKGLTEPNTNKKTFSLHGRFPAPWRGSIPVHLVREHSRTFGVESFNSRNQ